MLTTIQSIEKVATDYYKKYPHRHTPEHLNTAIKNMDEFTRQGSVAEYFWVDDQGKCSRTIQGACHSYFGSYGHYKKSVLLATCFKITDCAKCDYWHEYLCTESFLSPFIIYHDLEKGLVMSTSTPSIIMQMVNCLSRYSAESRWAIDAFYELMHSKDGPTPDKHHAFWVTVTSHLKPSHLTRYAIGSSVSGHAMAIHPSFNRLKTKIVNGEFIEDFFATHEKNIPYYESCPFRGVGFVIQGVGYELKDTWWYDNNLKAVFEPKKKAKTVEIPDPFARQNTYGYSTAAVELKKFWKEYKTPLFIKLKESE